MAQRVPEWWLNLFRNTGSLSTGQLAHSGTDYSFMEALMELSQKDRLILLNQYLILEKLYPENKEYYEKVKHILENGYELMYDYILRLPDPTSKEICQEVFDILEMYRNLNDSFRNLVDKSGIDKDDINFNGFDGNNEGDHLSLTDFLINEDNRYSEFKREELNSHYPTLKNYRNMLIKWKSKGGYHSLSQDEILNIINK